MVGSVLWVLQADEDARGAAWPPLLDRDHLERMAVTGAAFGLHLAEDEPAPAAGDDVELVPPGAGVRLEDPVPAQPIVAARPALRGAARVVHAA